MRFPDFEPCIAEFVSEDIDTIRARKAAIDEEECLVQTEAALDVASAYECDEEAEAYLDCELEKFRCFDETYQLLGSTCSEVRGQLFNCLDDTSKRSNGPYSPPSF